MCTATLPRRVETLETLAKSEFGIYFHLDWSVASIIPAVSALFSRALSKVLATWGQATQVP